MNKNAIWLFVVAAFLLPIQGLWIVSILMVMVGLILIKEDNAVATEAEQRRVITGNTQAEYIARSVIEYHKRSVPVDQLNYERALFETMSCMKQSVINSAFKRIEKMHKENNAPLAKLSGQCFTEVEFAEALIKEGGTVGREILFNGGFRYNDNTRTLQSGSVVIDAKGNRK